MFRAEGGDILFIYFLHISRAARRYFRKFLRSHQPWRWVPALCADFHGPSMSTRRYSGTVAMTASARKVDAKSHLFF